MSSEDMLRTNCSRVQFVGVSACVNNFFEATTSSSSNNNNNHNRVIVKPTACRSWWVRTCDGSLEAFSRPFQKCTARAEAFFVSMSFGPRRVWVRDACVSRNKKANSPHTHYACRKAQRHGADTPDRW